MIALFDHGNGSRRPIRGGQRSHLFRYLLGVGVLLELASACTGDLLNLGESDRSRIGDEGGANIGSAGTQQSGIGGTVAAGGAAGAFGGEKGAGSSSGAAGSGRDASAGASAGGGTEGGGPSASGDTGTGTGARGGGATAGAGGTGGDDDEGGCLSRECAIQLAHQEYAPVKIAVDDEHVYWMTEGVIEGAEGRRGKLHKVSKHGGAVQLLWTGDGPDLRALTVDSTHVYFASSPSLFAIPKSGGSTFTVFDGNSGGNPILDEPWGVAMTAEHIYWASRDLTGGIRRVAKTGGTISDLRVDDEGVAILAVHDDYLYWSTWNDSGQTALYRATLPDGPPQRIAPVTRYVRDLVGTDRYVFAAGDGVVRYSLNGEAPVVLSTGWSYSIKAYGEFVYWADIREGTVGSLRRARLDEDVSTVLVKELQWPLDMTLDADSVYWLEYRSDTPNIGTVMKFPR